MSYDNLENFKAALQIPLTQYCESRRFFGFSKREHHKDAAYFKSQILSITDKEDLTHKTFEFYLKILKKYSLELAPAVGKILTTELNINEQEVTKFFEERNDFITKEIINPQQSQYDKLFRELLDPIQAAYYKIYDETKYNEITTRYKINSKNNDLNDLASLPGLRTW